MLGFLHTFFGFFLFCSRSALCVRARAQLLFLGVYWVCLEFLPIALLSRSCSLFLLVVHFSFRALVFTGVFNARNFCLCWLFSTLPSCWAYTYLELHSYTHRHREVNQIFHLSASMWPHSTDQYVARCSAFYCCCTFFSSLLFHYMVFFGCFIRFAFADRSIIIFRFELDVRCLFFCFTFWALHITLVARLQLFFVVYSHSLSLARAPFIQFTTRLN